MVAEKNSYNLMKILYRGFLVIFTLHVEDFLILEENSQVQEECFVFLRYILNVEICLVRKFFKSV